MSLLGRGSLYFSANIRNHRATLEIQHQIKRMGESPEIGRRRFALLHCKLERQVIINLPPDETNPSSLETMATGRPKHGKRRDRVVEKN